MSEVSGTHYYVPKQTMKIIRW